MARCAADDCNRWAPELLARRVTGSMVDGRWFCSLACIQRMATRLLESTRPRASAITPMPNLRIGLLLRQRGLITRAQLETALVHQQTTRRRLGAQLVADGATGQATILRALAEQAGVPYLASLDPQRVYDAPGGLARDVIRALGVVPFSHPDDEQRIKVACVAPVPRAALVALNRLTGWSAQPYLVADDLWPALLGAYGVDSPRLRAPREQAFEQATSLPDAAKRIAAAATVARETTVTEVHWDPYTWVRVQSSDAVRDVLVSHAQPHLDEEAECPAAPTSH